VAASELEERREALEHLGLERDRLREQVEQLQAEIARQRAALAEAERRHDAVVRRSEVATVKAWTDEGWADHHPSGRFRAAVASGVPHDGGPPARSEWGAEGWALEVREDPDSARFGFPQPRTPDCFPGEADLALVRALVEILNQLLRCGPASGHVLIYQQRLTEFALKIREASRLAQSLASAVEQSRRHDQMQYHMYLVRRAGEIDQDL
jgi:hypothetical protein